MTKYISFHPKARHVVKSKIVYGTPIIELSIEWKRWYGWIDAGRKWHIEIELYLGEANDSLLRINPYSLCYNTGGAREVWIESTFSLEVRLKEMADRFLQSMERYFAVKSKVESIVTNG
jgi:hypothetical protein